MITQVIETYEEFFQHNRPKQTKICGKQRQYREQNKSSKKLFLSLESWVDIISKKQEQNVIF